MAHKLQRIKETNSTALEQQNKKSQQIPPPPPGKKMGNLLSYILL